MICKGAVVPCLRTDGKAENHLVIFINSMPFLNSKSYIQNYFVNFSFLETDSQPTHFQSANTDFTHSGSDSQTHTIPLSPVALPTQLISQQTPHRKCWGGVNRRGN